LSHRQLAQGPSASHSQRDPQLIQRSTPVSLIQPEGVYNSPRGHTFLQNRSRSRSSSVEMQSPGAIQHERDSSLVSQSHGRQTSVEMASPDRSIPSLEGLRSPGGVQSVSSSASHEIQSPVGAPNPRQRSTSNGTLGLYSLSPYSMGHQRSSSYIMHHQLLHPIQGKDLLQMDLWIATA
jgi:hypothetical protein